MPLSPKRAGSVLYSLAMFVVVSALAGLLVAGLFVPVAGLAAVTSKATASELEKLPADLQTPAQPQRTRVLLSDGTLLASFYEQNRTYVTLDNIAPVMREAQVAIEDHRFYEHGALDLKGTLRAFLRNQASDDIGQGGSTITQQYVKMVQVETAQLSGDKAGIAEATAKSYDRKIRELRYAIALEKKLSKDQILERYLNIAYFGEGAYGVQAAAQHYFRASAAKLTLPQAAMLAGLVQAPNNNPVQHEQVAIDRRDTVINRMAELKLVTATQATAAKKAKFDRDNIKPIRNGCIGTRYPFICDYVRESLLKSPSLGKTAEDRLNTINRGGLVIQTAIDPDAQDKAQKAVSNTVAAKDQVIATMNEIQPGTGLIVSMAQSRNVMGADKKKGETYFNYSASSAYNGAEGFQAGSTFKAFTVAAALEKGIPVSKRFNAAATMNFTGSKWETCDGTYTQIAPYTPKNSTGVNGSMNMRRAAEYSVNTYFLQLEQTIGLCDTVKMASRLGVKASNGDDLQQVPSFTLGVSYITPLSMAEAYATFASGGIHCDPIAIESITTQTGKKLDPPSANCKRVISEEVADGVNDILGSVINAGTGRPARLDDGRDQAGKTGTINGSRAVWFAGYTPDLAGVASIAVDNTRREFQPGGARYNSGVSNLTLNDSGTYLSGTGGGDAGSKIWKPAMTTALDGVSKSDFNEPSDDILNGEQTTVPNFYNLDFDDAKDKFEEAGFSVLPSYEYSNQPYGSFLGWSTYEGQQMPEFGTIYYRVSSGEDPAKKQARDDAAKKKAEEEKKKEEEQKPDPAKPPAKPGG